MKKKTRIHQYVKKKMEGWKAESKEESGVCHQSSSHLQHGIPLLGPHLSDIAERWAYQESSYGRYFFILIMPRCCLVFQQSAIG